MRARLLGDQGTVFVRLYHLRSQRLRVHSQQRGRPMKKQILIVTTAALTAAFVILSGTRAATAQQPQYQVAGFPITQLQMSVLQPSAKITEQQRLSLRRTMDASRGAVVRDFGLANSGWQSRPF